MHFSEEEEREERKYTLPRGPGGYLYVPEGAGGYFVQLVAIHKPECKFANKRGSWNVEKIGLEEDALDGAESHPCVQNGCMRLFEVKLDGTDSRSFKEHYLRPVVFPATITKRRPNLQVLVDWGFLSPEPSSVSATTAIRNWLKVVECCRFPGYLPSHSVKSSPEDSAVPEDAPAPTVPVDADPQLVPGTLMVYAFPDWFGADSYN